MTIEKTHHVEKAEHKIDSFFLMHKRQVFITSHK